MLWAVKLNRSCNTAQRTNTGLNQLFCLVSIFCMTLALLIRNLFVFTLRATYTRGSVIIRNIVGSLVSRGISWLLKFPNS